MWEDLETRFDTRQRTCMLVSGFLTPQADLGEAARFIGKVDRDAQYFITEDW